VKRGERRTARRRPRSPGCPTALFPLHAANENDVPTLTVLWLQRPWPGSVGRSTCIRGALSRKGAKSRTHGRKLRSTGTKTGQRVTYGRNSDTRLQEQLEARTRELAEAQRQVDEARRQAAEALEQQTAASEVLHIIISSPGDASFRHFQSAE
jgi:hypothetical protein